jgi:hypothetical protein
MGLHPTHLASALQHRDFGCESIRDPSYTRPRLPRLGPFHTLMLTAWILTDLKDEDEWEPEGSESIPQLSEIRDSIRQLEAENAQHGRFKSSGRIMYAHFVSFA